MQKQPLVLLDSTHVFRATGEKQRKQNQKENYLDCLSSGRNLSISLRKGINLHHQFPFVWISCLFPPPQPPFTLPTYSSSFQLGNLLYIRSTDVTEKKEKKKKTQRNDNNNKNPALLCISLPTSCHLWKQILIFFPRHLAKQSSTVCNSETFTQTPGTIASTNFMHRRHHLTRLKSHTYQYGIFNLRSVLTTFITTLLLFKSTSKPWKTRVLITATDVTLNLTGQLWHSSQKESRRDTSRAEILSRLPFPTLCSRTRKALKAGRHRRSRKTDFISDLRRKRT